MIQVRQRPTELTVEAAHTDNRVFLISGTLAVPNGPVVPDRSVEIRVNGTAIGTTMTGANGTFETTVIIPESVTSGNGFDSVTPALIEVVYETDDTNLGSSTASTTARLPIGVLGDWLTFAAIPALFIIAVGIVLSWWRRDPQSAGGEFDESAGWQASVGEDVAAESVLSRARDTLAEGQSVVAAQLVYAALRTHLESEYRGNSSQTHWEFYHRCEELDDDELATLRDATEVYERVVFAANAVTAESVESVLDRTEQLIDADSNR
jgi:hypothetical protein